MLLEKRRDLGCHRVSKVMTPEDHFRERAAALEVREHLLVLLHALESEGVRMLEMMVERLRAKEPESRETVESRLARRAVADDVLDGLERSPVAAIERLAKTKRGRDAEEHRRRQKRQIATTGKTTDQPDESEGGEDRKEGKDQEEMLVRHSRVERKREHERQHG